METEESVECERLEYHGFLIVKYLYLMMIYFY